VLLDENDQPGGQLFKQIHRFFGTSEHYASQRGYQIGRKLLAEVEELGVDVRLSTVVWGAFGGPVLACATANGDSYHLPADRVILATGASELAIDFPGWTLPGVMGAGAAQTLANIHRVLPGRRVLMVGSGNVGLIVSFQLMQAGAKVAAVVEAAPQIGGWLVNAARVRRAGVPVLTRHTIVEATGRDQVTGAVVAQIDESGQPVPGTERRFRVDLVCLAVGLRPQNELARMLDLRMVDDPARGGRVPWRDGRMRSSDERVYVAGDLAGITEASSAMEEGRIAGRAAAASLGYGSAEETERIIGEAHERLSLLSREVSPIPLSALSTRARPWRHADGPTAVIECPQPIPCDPCERICPQGAIHVGPDPMTPPAIEPAKCNGCLRCVRECPGMAIFVVDRDAGNGEAKVAIPWEFLPLPQVGDEGRGLDRAGRSVCPARVVEVLPFRRLGDTAVVIVGMPLPYLNRVRGFRAVAR
jgi:NADPH-dependent 2,4-dienoyl-CoA reductase/sulfur reductase-like enzyme/Fe-S-cluster-containing hydrogenase component 2